MGGETPAPQAKAASGTATHAHTAHVLHAIAAVAHVAGVVHLRVVHGWHRLGNGTKRCKIR